ncbi:MAG: SDR family oxidoreductase [Phaeodactylibacter sp.]|nr:SDR family oxidoreductase [Phaeodactylibacter sp.]MCB9287489.1 SDR family oxidoreductase [Lewinellaceae bacterium]
MRILLTGATGYIGKRLLPVLLKEGHEVICCIRNEANFRQKQSWRGQVSVFEVDFLEEVDTGAAPLDFDVAFYLIHSMSAAINNFQSLEERAARNFRKYIEQSSCRQAIYLTGIVNNDELSTHLESRLRVEKILSESTVPLTALRAGIIIGSGSASFEIVRDLVEKLPVMVAPRWLETRCQPIAIRNVIQFLAGVMLREDCYNQNFDIGCSEILTYREMLQGYAEVRGLRRLIITVPVMTPRLSSYWLYFVTSTTYELAVNLVNSMKVDVVCRDNRLAKALGISPAPYKEAVRLAFDKIQQNMVVSSWKDSLVSSSEKGSLAEYMEVPEHGCFEDRKEVPVRHNTVEQVWSNVMAIGGQRGWYYGNLLWRLRGLLDKMVGGIGLRRGRTHPERIHSGDALDFWRVLVADERNKRLLLYAEMKLPGEAWLEFRIVEEAGQLLLRQKATFRPFGIGGRLYWYLVLPFHFFIFNGMIRNIERFRPPGPIEEQVKEAEEINA